MMRKKYEGEQFLMTLVVPPHLLDALEGDDAGALIVHAVNTCLLALSLDAPWDRELMTWLSSMQNQMRFGVEHAMWARRSLLLH